MCRHCVQVSVRICDVKVLRIKLAFTLRWRLWSRCVEPIRFIRHLHLWSMWQVEVTFSERRFPYTELTLATGMSVLSMTNLDSAVFVRQGFGSSSWPTPVTAGHEALRLTYVLHVDCLLWGGKFRKASTAYFLDNPTTEPLCSLWAANAGASHGSIWRFSSWILQKRAHPWLLGQIRAVGMRNFKATPERGILLGPWKCKFDWIQWHDHWVGRHFWF